MNKFRNKLMTKRRPEIQKGQTGDVFVDRSGKAGSDGERNRVGGEIDFFRIWGKAKEDLQIDEFVSLNPLWAIAKIASGTCPGPSPWRRTRFSSDSHPIPLHSSWSVKWLKDYRPSKMVLLKLLKSFISLFISTFLPNIVRWHRRQSKFFFLIQFFAIR